MTPPVPFDTFSAELLPGEKVRWSGRPDPSVIFHPEDLLAIPFSLLWGGFAIFWLVGASGIWNFGGNAPGREIHWFGVIWGTPFVLIGQYLIWGRFVYSRWWKNRTTYALTDRRALILSGRSSSSARFDDLAMVDMRVRADGNGSISFGGPFRSEWPWSRSRLPRPLTFDDVDNARAVYDLALRLYRNAASHSPAR